MSEENIHMGKKRRWKKSYKYDEKSGLEKHVIGYMNLGISLCF